MENSRESRHGGVGVKAFFLTLSCWTRRKNGIVKDKDKLWWRRWWWWYANVFQPKPLTDVDLGKFPRNGTTSVMGKKDNLLCFCCCFNTSLSRQMVKCHSCSINVCLLYGGHHHVYVVSRQFNVALYSTSLSWQSSKQFFSFSVYFSPIISSSAGLCLQ